MPRAQIPQHKTPQKIIQLQKKKTAPPGFEPVSQTNEEIIHFTTGPVYIRNLFGYNVCH